MVTVRAELEEIFRERTANDAVLGANPGDVVQLPDGEEGLELLLNAMGRYSDAMYDMILRLADAVDDLAEK